MGPLAHCYALGEVAFVGGSLVPIGGHNVLEPARAARPVIVGPHTATAEDAVERILAGGGGRRVRDGRRAGASAASAARRSGGGARRWGARARRRSRPGRARSPGTWRSSRRVSGPERRPRGARRDGRARAPRSSAPGRRAPRPSVPCGRSWCRRRRRTAPRCAVRNALYDAGWLGGDARARAGRERRQPHRRRDRQDAGGALAGARARAARAARRDRRARLPQAPPRASWWWEPTASRWSRRRTAATRP